MLPDRPRQLSYGQRALVLDVLMVGLTIFAVELASPTASPTGEVPITPIYWLLAFCGLSLLLFKVRGMYEAPLRLEFTETFRLILAGTALAAIVVMAGRVLFANDRYVAAETLRHWLLLVLFLTLGRALLLSMEARGRTTLGTAKRTLIVGAGKVGHTAATRLLGDPTLGLRPVAFLDDDPLDIEDPHANLPIYGWDYFEDAVERERIEHVIIAFSAADHELLLPLIRRCWESGVGVSVVPRLFEVKGSPVSIEHLGGLPLLRLDPTDPKGWQFRLKYMLDRVVALALLLFLMPVLLVAVVAVLISLGRPIFYRQWRVGRDGQAFEMLKLRTLHDTGLTAYESDADWAERELGNSVAVHMPLEERLTRAGRFLRRSSIDELPQLWNVLRGEMSLVGPRPERVGYVEQFEGRLYRYQDRHRVKSGLTGWAQINGLRGKTSLRDRIEWDNHYIENWSPWLDMKILMLTLRAVVRHGR
jgi:exopolysaccharide biosynthesis polyprenyl glycosylphosphotransferase